MEYQLHQSIDFSQRLSEVNAESLAVANSQPIHFQAHFQGYMEMYSNLARVAEYLNAHEDWFCRCAQPMKVEPLGDNGYVLVLGKFGSFGYEVEPKIAVVLQPPQDRVYLMYSISVPDCPPPSYEIDYQARMELTEIPGELACSDIEKVFAKQGFCQCPAVVTQVQWELQMEVAVQFPKFIRKLPLSLIQSTGDRVLAEIIRQVSPRLTYKVQEDFHSLLNLPIPPKTSRHLQRITNFKEIAA
jgi:hypothetical protein